MKKARINISSALKARGQTSPSDKEKTEEEISRKKVRDALEARKNGHALSVDEIRQEALGNNLKVSTQQAPVKRVRLSEQRLKNSESRDSSSPPKTDHGPRFSPRLSRRKCRDSIFFKSDLEYEEYLFDEKERHGLYPDLYEHLKILYVSRKNIPGLLSLWDELEDSGLDSCEAHLERAETLRQMNEIDKAMLYLEKAQRMEPNSVIALRSLTITNKLKKDYELALHWGEKWRQVAPGEAECSYQLGSIHHRANSYELARNHLKRCLELDPAHLMARSLLESIGFDN